MASCGNGVRIWFLIQLVDNSSRLISSPPAAGDRADLVQDCGYCIRLRPWHRSSLLQRRLHSAPQWSTPPVEQTSVRPIMVACSSREPGHSSADETCCSNCLEQFLSSSTLTIHQLRTIQSWVENPSLQSSLRQPLRTICFKTEFTY